MENLRYIMALYRNDALVTISYERMNTRMKRLFSIITALALLLCTLMGTAMAESSSVTLRLSTDREAYQTGDTVRCTLEVENPGDQELTIGYDLTLPDGLTPAAAQKGQLVVGAGEKTTGSFALLAVKGADGVPSTGDSFPVELLLCLFALALAAVLVISKRRKQMLLFMLVFVLLFGMMEPALVAYAEGVDPVMETEGGYLPEAEDTTAVPEDAFQTAFEDEAGAALTSEAEQESAFDTAELNAIARDGDAAIMATGKVLDERKLEKTISLDGQLVTIVVNATVSTGGDAQSGMKATLATPSFNPITIQGKTKFKLVWKAVPGATHYEVWHQLNGTYVKKVTTAKLTWTTNYGTAGVINTYKVRAVVIKDGVTTAKSAYATRTAYGMDTPSITKVAYVSATSNQVRLTIKAASFCTGYNVYRSTTGEPGTYVWIGKTTGLSFVDKYHNAYYKIRPYYEGKNGISYSGPASALNNMPNPFDIIEQPTSCTVNMGETAKASVKAMGKGLTYTWYYADKGETTFHKSKITANSYSFKMSASLDGRTVYCVVQDTSGRKRTSSKAVFGMNKEPLKILKQPTDQTAGVGQEVSVEFDVTGAGLTYAWYYADAGVGTFTKSHIVNPFYYEVMTESNSERRVYCIVTDQYGQTVKTDTVTLYCANPLMIVKQPENDVVQYGETATFSVKAVGSGLSYQWYYRTPGMDDFSAVGSNAPSYSFTMGDSRCEAYCVVTDRHGATRTSHTATINCGTPLKITQQPQSVWGQAGETVTVSVVAEGDGLSYMWEYLDSLYGTFEIADANGPEYTLYMDGTVTYRALLCYVRDMYGNYVCTDDAYIRLGTELKLTKELSNASAAIGKTASVTVSAVGDGLTYQWFHKDLDTSWWEYELSPVTSKTYSLQISDSCKGKMVYCVVSDAYGHTVETNRVSLTASNQLLIVEQPSGWGLRVGETGESEVLAVGDGLTYQWYYKDATDKAYKKSKVTSSVYKYTRTIDNLNWRSVYCVVTDAYGNSVQSEKAMFDFVSPYGDYVQVHEGGIVRYYGDNQSFVVVPDEWYGNIPTTISSYCFTIFSSEDDCLYSVHLPDTIRVIEEGAFSERRNLKYINLPDGLQTIGGYAFIYCASLETLTIPASVTSIGGYAFEGCYNLTLTVTKGSYAETYAINNDIPYVYAK